MSNNFNTTFIPKRAPSGTHVKIKPKMPVGFLSIIAGIFFFTSIVSVVGVFLYEKHLMNEITIKREKIASIQSGLDKDVLYDLKVLDKKFKVSKKLLDEHIAISPFLKDLALNTIPAVQYNDFSLSFGRNEEEGGVIDISARPSVIVNMSGEATSYKSVAQQSKLFGASDYITDHLFSGLKLEKSFGRVAFLLEFVLDKDAILFKDELTAREDILQ